MFTRVEHRKNKYVNVIKGGFSTNRKAYIYQTCNEKIVVIVIFKGH